MQILENCRQLVVLILQGAIKPSQKKRAQQDNVINWAPDTKKPQILETMEKIRWKCAIFLCSCGSDPPFFHLSSGREV